MSFGIYAGIPYHVVEKEGKLYIALEAGLAMKAAAEGANMKLLDNIGDQDPDDVMKLGWSQFLPKRNKSTEIALSKCSL